ncbi:MAG: hypothetical protein EOT04_02800 [Candidatus Chaera renei]|uniref:Uncharacterized protein n=1 Tax=Candidatus Chaera renei TaxID=2506947 RepID=A0A4Q0AG72_9BACT|nr:MAG: hypothetical protein EOT04_02800 [Candidatus Chaera renei]
MPVTSSALTTVPSWVMVNEPLGVKLVPGGTPVQLASGKAGKAGQDRPPGPGGGGGGGGDGGGGVPPPPLGGGEVGGVPGAGG